MSPPERLPPMLGDEYMPPGQPFIMKYCSRRKLFGRKSSTELPFSA